MIRPSSRTTRWLFIYGSAIALILVGLGALLLSHQDGIMKAILGFFLPDNWIFAGEMLVQRVFEKSPAVFVNTLFTLMLVLLPALTFPLKEFLSASYEEDLNAKSRGWEKPKEAPLWLQALDELLLLVVFVTLTFAALRLTLTPGLKTYGVVLSFFVTAIAAAVDFIGPTLARHHFRPSEIYRVLFTRFPKRTLFFGVIFALPAVFLGKLVIKFEPAIAFVLLASVNLVFILSAVLIGTFFGSWMATRDEPKPATGMRYLAWAAVVGLLVFNGLFFAKIGSTFLNASPVLKCEWKLVSGSFKMERPTFKDPTVRVSFDVDVTNPTDRLAQVEDNDVTLTHNNDVVATTKIPQFSVKAGTTDRQHIIMTFKPAGKGLAKKGLALLGDMKKDGFKDALMGAAKRTVDKTLYGVVLTIPTDTGDFHITLKKGPPKT